MGFFARPNLEDVTFKQLSGSTLTLSGQTRIANPTGLTLTDGGVVPVFRPIIATGGTNYDVLTLINNKIILAPSTASGSSSGIYTCASPTTCTVGGLLAGSPISGCTISKILEEILVPTLNPILTAPSSTFNVPLSNPYEVGTVVSVIGTTILDRGSISPQYSSASPFRSCGAISHNYVDFNGISCSCFGGNLTCTYALPAYTVFDGVRCAFGSVSYCAGVQPKDSSGANFSTPLVSGITTPIPSVICGLYPYFYGTVASSGHSAGVCRPTPTCALVIAGTKVVAYSLSSIYINFNSTSDDYIWFAIPSGSTSKTCWYVNALNNGNIGGAVSAGGNLFPAPASVNPVATVCWSGQTYKVYVSNYQTAVNVIMELRN